MAVLAGGAVTTGPIIYHVPPGDLISLRIWDFSAVSNLTEITQVSSHREEEWVPLVGTKGIGQLWEDIQSMEFSPQGNLLAITEHGGAYADNEKRMTYYLGAIRFIDAKTGKTTRVIDDHAGDISTIAFSPDGKVLATGIYKKGMIHHKHTVKVTHLNPRDIQLFSTATGKKIGGFYVEKGPVHSVAYSPNGKFLASASEDRCVRIWEAATGVELAKLVGHNDAVYSVSFSPDGKQLASGSLDGTVIIWDVENSLGHKKHVYSKRRFCRRTRRVR